MWRTLCKIFTFNHEFPNERPQKHPTNTPKGVGADSSCPYPSIIKNVYIRYQIRISTLLYIYSFQLKRISVPHFVGIYGYAGTINLPLQLLMDCEQGNEHSVENSHSPTKWVANILLYRLFSIVILFVRC